MSPRSLLFAVIILCNLPGLAQATRPKIPVHTFQAMLEAGQYRALCDSAMALRKDDRVGKHYVLDYYIAMAVCNTTDCDKDPVCALKSAKWWGYLLDNYSPPGSIRALFEQGRNSCGAGRPGSGSMITALSGLKIESGVVGHGTPDRNRLREEQLMIEQEEASHAIILDVLGRLSDADDKSRSKAIEVEIELENLRHNRAVDSLRNVYMDPSARGIKEQNDEINRRNEEVVSLGSAVGTSYSKEGEVKPLPYLIQIEPTVEGETGLFVEMDAMDHARWMTRNIAPGSVAVKEIAEP
jgi:hypothetical protein